MIVQSLHSLPNNFMLVLVKEPRFRQILVQGSSELCAAVRSEEGKMMPGSL